MLPGERATSNSNHFPDGTARPMKAEWVREVRDQCEDVGVAFLFKQWGGLRPKSGGRELDGREWSDFPKPLGHFETAAE